jgi:proline dehydrogenase
MFRSIVMSASRSSVARELVGSGPVSRAVVRRFVAGERDTAALDVARTLLGRGLWVSLDRLGEDTGSRASAAATADAYVRLIGELRTAGFGPACEVSVKLSSLGLALEDGLATRLAGRICAAAAEAGTTVTLDMEGHTTTAATLAAAAELRSAYRDVGVAVQAQLRRTEADCVELARASARVRLCKGAYAAPPALAWRSRRDVSRSYARCLAILMAGTGYPMVATHDPGLIALAGRLAAAPLPGPGPIAGPVAGPGDRRPFEYQMLYGVRPDAQSRLTAAGAAVRVYVPYGQEWYGYLTRRIAERPANMMFFLRALTQRSGGQGSGDPAIL